MPRLMTFQSNLSAGEVDPKLRTQVELKAYANGALKVRNCLLRGTGGAERRPGFLDLADATGLLRLEAFEFSNDQRYVVAFGDAAWTMFDLNGVVLDNGVGPWTSDQVADLTTTQQGDVMMVAHQGFMVRELKRLSAVDFELNTFEFELSIDSRRLYAPFYKFTKPGVTLKPSAATGAITVTASEALFTADYVGKRLRIYDCDVLITAYVSPTVVNATVQGEIKFKLDIDPFKTTRGSTTVEVLHPFHGLATGQTVTISGANGCGKIPANYFNGTFAVTVLDDTRYTIELGAVAYDVREDLNQDGTDETNAYTAAHDSEDGGGSNVHVGVAGAFTRQWMEEAINDIRGYPGACCFHDGRFWLGATSSQPDATFGSNALNSYRFDVGKGYDGDSVQLGAGSEDASRIYHLVSNGDLQVLSATREAVFVTRDGEPITPTNARTRNQGDAGSGHVQPVSHDSATLFIQENGLMVSEFVFSSEQGGYRPNPIAVLAGHLIRNPVHATASPGTLTRAEKFAYFANDDGTIAVYRSMRQENIAGWGLWELGAGEAISVCAVGPYLFALVNVRGTTRLYRLGDDDLDVLDGMVRHVSGTGPKPDWTLDARVRGRDCAIVTELGYHGVIAVPADGVIDLGVDVETVSAGDAFFAEIETLPPVVQLPSGPQMGNLQRIVRSVVEFDETLHAVVGSVDIGMRLATDEPEGVPTPYSGSYESRHFGYSRNPTLRIWQRAPLPMRVLGILLEVKV